MVFLRCSELMLEVYNYWVQLWATCHGWKVIATWAHEQILFRGWLWHACVCVCVMQEQVDELQQDTLLPRCSPCRCSVCVNPPPSSIWGGFSSLRYLCYLASFGLFHVSAENKPPPKQHLLSAAPVVIASCFSSSCDRNAHTRLLGTPETGAYLFLFCLSVYFACFLDRLNDLGS